MATIASGPRVALVSNDLSGLLHFRRAIIEALLQHGVRCTVVGPFRDGVFARMTEVAATLDRLGVHAVEWSISRRGVNPASEALAIWRLFLIYRRLRPDLVHHVTPKPVLYGGIAARCAGVFAIINAVSGQGYTHGRGGWKRGLLRKCIAPLQRWAHGGRRTRVIVQNPEDQAALVASKAVSPAHCRLIRGSGVDTNLWLPAAILPREPIVMVACRMLTDKGIHDVIAAARILRERGIPIQVRLAGALDPGNPQAIPEARLQAWKAEGIATWLGAVKEMAPCWRTARIACLPTYYAEGLPKALIEAASCGLPLVTTDTPGCRDICRPGLNGILIPPRDPVTLADALAELLANYDKCIQLGRQGRQRVIDEFDVRLVVGRHLDVYRELLSIT